MLSDWLTDLPRDDLLTKQGGTFLPDAYDTILYSHQELGILGFSQTMGWPINFLVCSWNEICIQAWGWPIGIGNDKRNPAEASTNFLIFTRIKNQDNIQSSHGNIGDASSDCVNLRDNLALLIDKCQRPAFS